jgi:nitrogenase molybdenum-iron protein alpha/beta subunit
MRGFYSVLPTLSPDFSGVCSTLFELGGTLIIHDAGGCTGTYTGYDEPRWFDRKSRIFTSNLDDAEAVFGDDGILLGKAVSAHDYIGGAFFALMGSPSPAVLGTDYQALCRLIASRTGKPATGFSTNGTEFYDKGVTEALLGLAKLFLPRTRPKILPGSVNLLGATPLDLTHQRNVDIIRFMLEDAGIALRSVWAMGASLEEIQESLAAQCNIALTVSALPLCRYLEKHYGMPYLIGSFSGLLASSAFLQRLKNTLAGKRHPADLPSVQGKRRALVIGEQLIANGIRRALEADFGYGPVDVYTFFSAEKACQREGDRHHITEAFLSERILTGAYDLIVGDGLFRLFEGEGCTHRFIEIPHVAVSSRLGWTSENGPFGEGLYHLMQSAPERG